jgi:hypothetical protein
LKCLIVLNGKTPSKTHDTEELFEELSASQREEITRRYEEERKTSKTASGAAYSIEQALKDSANAFDSHRFIYELDDPCDASPFKVQVLANVVWKMIVESHPDWNWGGQ